MSDYEDKGIGYNICENLKNPLIIGIKLALERCGWRIKLRTC